MKTTSVREINDWMDACSRVRKAYRRASYLKEIAEKADPPPNLRPAVAEDIVKDAVIWYPDNDERKWFVVEEVHSPSDPWKSFYADDGSRYGLLGAFVEY